MTLTENSISDDAVVKEMLEQIEQTLLSCAADGAYDKRKVYDTFNKMTHLGLPESYPIA